MTIDMPFSYSSRNRKWVTKDGLELIRVYYKELEQKRIKAIEALQVARQHGDLSENAEYDSAREELTRINEQLAEVAPLVKDSEVAAIPPDRSVARFGARVSLVKVDEGGQELPRENGNLRVFRIASEMEARLDDKTYLCFEAPLAQSVICKRVGDLVSGGGARYRVVEVGY